MLNWFKRLKEKIEFSYCWAKFGWNDNDYDYTKIFDALIFKLRMHEKAMVDHDRHESSHKDAADMGRAADLIDAALNETNKLASLKYLEEKYGKFIIHFTDDKPFKQLIINRSKIETEEQKKEYKADLLRVTMEGIAKDDNLLKEGLDIILNKYRKWWF
jgi:hypothetical protein